MIAFLVVSFGWLKIIRRLMIQMLSLTNLDAKLSQRFIKQENVDGNYRLSDNA